MGNLLSTLLEVRSPGGARLLRESLSGDIRGLSLAYATCFRWLGTQLLRPDDQELSRLHLVDPEVDWTLWSRDDLARLILLQVGLEKDPQFIQRVADFFDLRESVACARSLALLPNPASYDVVAREFCRTNTRDIFCAMAWGNPWPARHFDDAAFNHLVFKALFMEISLEPIVGLRRRVNDETLRMAADWSRELRSAGRPLPKDLARLSESVKEGVA